MAFTVVHVLSLHKYNNQTGECVVEIQYVIIIIELIQLQKLQMHCLTNDFKHYNTH